MSKSVEELFKDAPNGATHYNSANHMFYRFCGGRGEVFHFSFIGWQDASALHEYGSLMIERPQPRPWSGPEDGLPPVGTVCEIRQIWNPGNWSRREVFYISYHNLITGIDGLEWHDDTRAVEFRQVRTPEQIATEEREMAREIGVAQMMEHIYFSLPKELWDECKPACYALYDAGFKREVA